MAKPIKRIEKDFFLKVLYDEQIPLMYLKNRTEYTLTLRKPAKDKIFFKADRPIEGLKIHSKVNLIFDYRGQPVSFIVNITGYENELITGEAPEFLYRNLARSFSRTLPPQDLQIQFILSGEHYSLSFPRIKDYEGESDGDELKNINPADFGGLIDQMKAWIKDNASGYKVNFFNDAKPSSIEEQLIAQMGKTLYIPSTTEALPQSDPYPQKRIITGDMFRRYLESTGVDLSRVDQVASGFVRGKFNSGILSEIWVPVLFQEYVIGYIHVWISGKDKKPLDYAVVDTLYQYASILVFSLKLKGYFEKGKLGHDSFEGKVIDISVSGLLFTCPHSSPLSAAVLLDKEFSVRLTSPRRFVTVNAQIVRHHKDNTQDYFGCRFLNMAPEDMRFLFEYLYGKTFFDEDISFLSGQV